MQTAKITKNSYARRFKLLVDRLKTVTNSIDVSLKKNKDTKAEIKAEIDSILNELKEIK